jgi:outer membrane lipoprotein LolB
VISATRLRACLLVLSLTLLSACAGTGVRPSAAAAEASQAARELALAGRQQWAFTGRVALANGDNGGSGRIEWTQDGDDFDIRLSAPITRQSWRVVREHGLVRLEGLEGGTREGEDAEALLLEATGWRLPVAAMAAWVRGLRGPGQATVTGDPLGLPASLAQAGWQVEYREWDAATPPLPRRIYATKGQASVRLVVEQWTAP